MAQMTAETAKYNQKIANRQQEGSKPTSAAIHASQTSTNDNDPTATTQQKTLNKDQVAFLTFAQGQRPYQQDRVGLYQLSNLDTNTLSPAQLAANLEATFLALGNTLRTQTSGSTLSAFIITTDHVITANVGDSRVILIHEKNNQNYSCQRLTWDHKPTEIEEIKRIQAAGGEIMQLDADVQRLNGILAVSRAFGDAEVGPGLIFQPDINWINTTKYNHAFILACTDGITDVLHEEDIAAIFAKYKTQNQITTKIQQLAFQLGSPDNKAILLIPISNQQPKNEILLGFVADGHGGDKTVNFIQDNFISLFSEQFKKNRANHEIKIIKIF